MSSFLNFVGAAMAAGDLGSGVPSGISVA